MGTAALITVTDSSGDKIFFHREGDGDPAETMPVLEKFLDMRKQRLIRSCPDQSAGWLVLLGHEAQKAMIDGWHEEARARYKLGMGWKVGFFEPAVDDNYDADWNYVINLSDETIEYHERNRN